MLIKIINEQHWQQLRSNNIGGSEIASLFSEQEEGFFTKYELWHLKNGTLPNDFAGNERTRWGNLLEDSIAKGVQEMFGYIIDESYTGQYALHPWVLGMGCTPDRIVTHPGKEGKGVLQIKNMDYFQFKKLEDGAPPLKYLLQVQHEMACTELSWGVLAILVGGNDLKIFPIERREKTIKIIEEAVSDFWQSIQDKKEPDVVGDDYDIIRKVHSAVNDNEWIEINDGVAAALCAELEIIQRQKKDAEDREKEIKASLLQRVGEAGGAVIGEYQLSRKKVERKGYEVKPSSYVQIGFKRRKTG